MNTLLVSYDLMKTGKDYQAVHDYLRGYDEWCKPLYSVYLIYTSKSPSQVRDELQTVIDSNDKVLVVLTDLSEWASFNLPDVVNTWLKNH